MHAVERTTQRVHLLGVARTAGRSATDDQASTQTYRSTQRNAVDRHPLRQAVQQCALNGQLGLRLVS